MNRNSSRWASSSRIACVLPACDGFVCSQERIKAIELANRGTEEFKNNLYDSAEKDLKQAIQTDPTYEIAYYNLGKVFQKQRKWDKAIESFEQAVAAQAGQRQLPVRPRRGLPRVEEDRPGREGAEGGDRRRSQALQGLVAARPGLQDARPPEGGRRRAPRTPSRPTRASRSRTSRSGTSTSTTTSTRRRLRSSRAA